MNRITKTDVKAAFRTSLPIMVTFVVLGMGYGLLMQKNGFGPLWSLACRIIFGRDLFLIPAMVIIIAVLTVMRGRIEQKEGDTDA